MSEPTPAPAAVPTAGALLSPSTRLLPLWQRERLQKLAHILRCIDRRVAAGQGLLKAIDRFARIWGGRRFKSAPGRRIRVSRGTLVRLWYLWTASGRAPEALALHYRSKVSAGAVIEMARLCRAPGVDSFAAAYRKLESPAGTVDAYRDAMPAPIRAAVEEMLAARRKVAALERAAARAIDKHTAAKGGDLE